MTSFRNLSLKIKMTLIITLTSCAALLLACAVFVAYELHSFRGNLVLELTTLAEIGALNQSAVAHHGPITDRSRRTELSLCFRVVASL